MATDNSNFEKKVLLRLDALQQIDKDEINVLDCFAGYGLLWQEVKRRSDKTIKIVSIEKEKGKNPTALQGDNLKYLPTLDLSKFDIIDIDAYGVPTKQIEIITLRQWHGILIITEIESMMGNMPKELLFSVGIEDLYKENKAVFCSYFPQFLDNYLFQKGIKEKYGYFLGRKLYFYVSI